MVREGLRLVAEEETGETFGYTVEELRAAVQIGLDDMAAGRYVEFENVDDLVSHLRQLGDDVISGKVEP